MAKPSPVMGNPFQDHLDGNYWLGFFSADGCLHRTYKAGSSIKLKIGKKDIDHLKAYRDFLGIDNAITPTERCNVISFGSKEIFDYMLSLGIKTQDLPDELIECPDFMRGLIDGDGCINDNYGPTPVVRLSLCCEEVLAKKLAFKYGFRAEPVKGIWRIRTSANRAEDFLTQVYSKKGPVLKRKKDKLVSIMNARLLSSLRENSRIQINPLNYDRMNLPYEI